MAKSNRYLIAAGVISALISLLHVIAVFVPGLYRYISPGQGSELAQLAVQGSSLTTLLTAILALIFAVWAIYAFSGAGWLPRLPLLQAALVVIGAIYFLRALFLPTEINMVMTQGLPIRSVVFSTISLAAGLLYLIGFFRYRASLRLSQKS